MTRYPYAARLNSFLTRPELFWPGRTERPTTLDLIDRAATVEGLSAVDINYPQQAQSLDVAELRTRIADRGLTLNGYAMRYNGDPDFTSGGFTNADPAIRQRAIDLTRRGMDEAREAGGAMLTLWLGQDGLDHPFEADYAQLWELEVEGIRQVAAHDPDFGVSIEYKPNEPRAISVLPNIAATLLAIEEAGGSNLGVTLDFAHVLYGDESPAMAAALVGRRSRMLGLHINDGPCTPCRPSSCCASCVVTSSPAPCTSTPSPTPLALIRSPNVPPMWSPSKPCSMSSTDCPKWSSRPPSSRGTR